MEERAKREVQEYEEMTAIAEDNAAKAGTVNPNQYITEFTQNCKEFYLEDWKKKQEALKHILSRANRNTETR